jgi:hypothetical protein
MRSGLPRVGVSARKASVRDFFARYYWAYHDLTRHPEADRTALLEFFAVPLTVTTPETHLALTSPEAVVRSIGRQMDRLRQQPYERSIPVRSDFRILNRRSALAEVDWARTSRLGQEVSRLHLLYLVTETEVGTRITSMVVLGQSPEDVRGADGPD